MKQQFQYEDDGADHQKHNRFEDQFSDNGFKRSIASLNSQREVKGRDSLGGSGEMNEQLKTKEEEIKILWNVIKEINKSKGSEKVSVEQLQQVITSSRGTTQNNF